MIRQLNLQQVSLLKSVFMRSNRKQGLLDKRILKCLQAEEEWIQLQNVNIQCQKPQYQILDDQQITHPLGRKHKNLNKKHQQPVLSSEPIYPASSSNDKPNVIKMNGIVFQKQGVQTRSKKPKLPEMQVICQECGLKQTVPANSQAFICHQCQAASQCSPKYGVFICGSCETKVWYNYGTSSFIKCTKCGTVNNVPICPEKKCRDIKSKRKNVRSQELSQENQQIFSENYEQKYLQYPALK